MATDLVDDLVDDSGNRFIELKTKARDLEEKMVILEREEGEVGELYGNIFKAVYVQTGFFVTFSSCLVALFIKDLALYWMTSLIACVIFCFIIGVVCPIGFAYRQLSGLNYTCRKLIEERAKIHECCVSLLNDYSKILAFVSNISNNEDNENLVSNLSYGDDLLKNIIDFQTKKLEEFTKEDIVPKFWKKHNRKYILAIGLCCLMFTVMVLLYAIYKTKSQVVPGPSPTPSSPLVFLPTGRADDPALFSRQESGLSSFPLLWSWSRPHMQKNQ